MQRLASPDGHRWPLSRRRLFEAIGLGAAGATGLLSAAGCTDDGPKGQEVRNTSTGSRDGSAFHGAWPYLMPDEGGHFNLFTGLLDRITLGAYFDLVMAPGGLWYWADKKWLHILCESYEFNENAFIYNVTEGATWNNGEPITAADVEATFWCRWVVRQAEWKFIKAVEVTGDRQVTFRLEAPSSVVEYNIVRAQLYPASLYGEFGLRAKELFESGGTMDDPDGGKINDELQNWRPKNPMEDDSEVITSGPYRFDFGSMSTSQFVLNRVPNGVLADQVKFDQIVVYRGETEEITPLVLDKTLDFATHGFPLKTQEEFVDRGYRLLKPATYVGPSLTFSMDKVPMFKDFKARQALAHAIDREAAAEISLAESAVPTRYLAGFSEVQVPEWLTEDELAQLNPYKYNPDKAAALLEEAGWRRSGRSWLAPDGKPAEFTFHYPKELLDWVAAAKEVVRQLKDFGLGIELIPIENTELIARVPKGAFELTFQNWGVGNPHPAFSFEVDFISHNIPAAAAQLGRGMAFDLVQRTESVGRVDIQELLVGAGDGLDHNTQREFIVKLALVFNELLPKVPIFERFGNNAGLEGVRVREWPADDDPIYQNAVYGDNHGILLIFEGRLEPV